jgi:hypothetical protein
MCISTYIYEYIYIHIYIYILSYTLIYFLISEYQKSMITINNQYTQNDKILSLIPFKYDFEAHTFVRT